MELELEVDMPKKRVQGWGEQQTEMCRSSQEPLGEWGDIPQAPRCLVQLWVNSAFLLLVKHCFCNVTVRGTYPNRRA